MADSERALYAIAALICFGTAAYGLQAHLTRPETALVDVLPALLLVAPGSVAMTRVLGRRSTG